MFWQRRCQFPGWLATSGAMMSGIEKDRTGNEPVLAAWQVRSERFVVSDRWIRIRAQACETSEGARIDPFYLIDTADVVAVTAITEDDNLVLVERQPPFGEWTDVTYKAQHRQQDVGVELARRLRLHVAELDVAELVGRCGAANVVQLVEREQSRLSRFHGSLILRDRGTMCTEPITAMRFTVPPERWMPQAPVCGTDAGLARCRPSLEP